MQRVRSTLSESNEWYNLFQSIEEITSTNLIDADLNDKTSIFKC